MNDAVSVWLKQLAAGDELAAQRIWERYWQELVDQASKKLGGFRRRSFDEEDVALSAFNSFCQAARAGRYPQLNDRFDIWRLLLRITANKAAGQIRHELREKRGAGKVGGESILFRVGDDEQPGGINEVLGEEPSAELVAQMTDQWEGLLDALDDETLRTVAIYRLEGYRAREIAQMLGVARRTVERKLKLIRDKWERFDQ